MTDETRNYLLSEIETLQATVFKAGALNAKTLGMAALMARAGEGFALFVLMVGVGAVLAGQSDVIAGLPKVMLPP